MLNQLEMVKAFLECEKGFRENCLFMKFFVAVANFYLSLILTTNTLYVKKISVFRNWGQLWMRTLDWLLGRVSVWSVH